MGRRLRGLLLDNLLLKVVSFALAVLLFVVVRTEKQSLAYGTVRVSFTPPVGQILVGEAPGELQVSVLGPASRIPRFRFEDLVAVSIDLSSVKSGNLKFRPDMIRLPRGFAVAAIRPEGFEVRYEALVSREVPIRVTLEGQVAAGFQVVHAEAKPGRLSVRGPRSVVDALRELRTTPVSVQGARVDVAVRVRLVPPPPKVEVSGLPAEVEAQVVLGPVLPRITLGALPVVVQDAARRATTVQPPNVDVSVEGPPQVLANLDKDGLAARIELTGSERGTVSLAPEIAGLPDNVVVRAVVPSRVKVQIGGPQPAAPGRSPRARGRR